MKVIYTNGYSDGSGKGTIVKKMGKDEDAILRTHWGCSCCDYGATEKDMKLTYKTII